MIDDPGDDPLARAYQQVRVLAWDLDASRKRAALLERAIQTLEADLAEAHRVLRRIADQPTPDTFQKIRKDCNTVKAWARECLHKSKREAADGG